MSQRMEILADLKRGKSITALDALRDYGCFRLAARIQEIRESGHDVEMEFEPHNGGKHARYFLKRVAK